ncbi:MAG: DUF1840 domain-containing protein [Burkholderiaceae bacterium]|nr:DUF1840 domain-containing protein [Burkholderiaceae bacterium]
MTEPVMKMVFAAMEVEFAPKGIFTEERVPLVREKLAQAVARSRQQDQARLNQHEEAARAGEAVGQELPVGLSQRAFPLLEMLTEAEKKKVSVVWGV